MNELEESEKCHFESDLHYFWIMENGEEKEILATECGLTRCFGVVCDKEKCPIWKILGECI
jgi:hypothetical protein